MLRRAFTLIELLVVIAIIGLLLSIMAPSLARARKQGQSVSCRSNLRQLAIAAHIYVNDNDGYYPIAYEWSFSGSMVISYAWDFTTTMDASGLQQVQPGILWQGETIEKIQQCPSFRSNHNWLSDPYTGYNYNTSYIGHGSGETIVVPSKAADVGQPSGCALFGDGGYSGGANKFMRSPWPSPADESFFGRYAGTQSYRHLGSTNVAWCDGAVESTDDLYTDTSPAEAINIAAGTGFLSPDNSAYKLK